MTTKTAPLEFELGYHLIGADHNKRAGKFAPDEFTANPERRKTLPIVPPGFTQVRGDWPTVSKEADRLNDTQMKSGILDYFFYPEATPTDYDRSHCAMCRRIAAREALD